MNMICQTIWGHPEVYAAIPSSSTVVVRIRMVPIDSYIQMLTEWDYLKRLGAVALLDKACH